MSEFWRRLAIWFSLKQIAERDARAIGSDTEWHHIHDMKGQAVCPACGWFSARRLLK